MMTGRACGDRYPDRPSRRCDRPDEANGRAYAALALAGRLGAQLAYAATRSEADITIRATLVRTEDRAVQGEERPARADALVANLEADIRTRLADEGGRGSGRRGGGSRWPGSSAS
jgi:hypothetical protein